MFHYMDISADEGSAPSDNRRLQGAAFQRPGPCLIASPRPAPPTPAAAPGTPGREEGPWQLGSASPAPHGRVKRGLVPSPPLERGDGPPVPTGLGPLGPLQTLPALAPTRARFPVRSSEACPHPKIPPSVCPLIYFSLSVLNRRDQSLTSCWKNLCLTTTF